MNVSYGYTKRERELVDRLVSEAYERGRADQRDEQLGDPIVWAVTVSDLTYFADGVKFSEDEIPEIGEAIGNSSVPEALATVVGSFVDRKARHEEGSL